MYRCGLCNHCSEPRQPRLTHVIERVVMKLNVGTRTEIAQEIPVCRECHNLLKEGVSITQVVESMSRKRVKDAAVADTLIRPKKSQDWTSQAVPLSSTK